MTRIRTLYIGRGSFTVSLECGHVQCVDGWRSIPRPGSDYDCPDCRAQQAQALAEHPDVECCPNCRAQKTALLAAPFTSVELGHLKFYRWLWQARRTGA